MVENSAAGLVMVDGDAAITVTREEQHQSALARYAPAPGGERRVAVELTWCVIGTGKYKGQHAIEVRLDGHRVGELTYLMSQRYAPIVTRVNAHNGRAGCEAVIVREAKGLQLTLSLPRDPDAVPLPAARPAPRPTAMVDAPTVVIPHVGRAPVPAAASESTFTKHKKAWLVGAAVAAVFVVAGILGNNDDPRTSPTAADATTTTFDAPTTTPTTTTTTPPPPPTTTTVVQPPPAPVTQEPAPPPVTQQPAPPPVTQEPPAQSQCDPNYSGCVPVASDVDCAGGSGNGPAYAEGPVNVIGSDIYDLDKDKDGVACE
jgi:hypothetical protein